MTSPRDLPVVSGGVGGAVNGALVRGGLFDSSHRGNREARPSAAEPDTPSIASLFTGVETEAQNGAVPQRLGPRCCRQLDRCSAPGGRRGRWAATRCFSSLGCWPLPVPCCFRVTVFSSLIPEGFSHTRFLFLSPPHPVVNESHFTNRAPLALLSPERPDFLCRA